MNLGHWIFVSILSSVAVAGCSPEYKEGTLLPIREKGTTVRWDGSYRLDKANYYIDGVKVGVGLKGFDAVLKHLSRLRTASAVKIESPMEWRTMGYDGKVDLWWEFPFESFPEKEKEFSKLCSEKSLHKTFAAIEESDPKK